MLRRTNYIFSDAFKTQIQIAILSILSSLLSPKLEHLGALNLLYIEPLVEI